MSSPCLPGGLTSDYVLPLTSQLYRSHRCDVSCKLLYKLFSASLSARYHPTTAHRWLQIPTMAHTIKDTGQSIVPATRFLDLSNEVQTITYDYCFSGLQVTLSEAYDEKIHTYKSTLTAPRNSTALLLVSRHIYELAKTRLLQNYEVFAHSFCDVGHGHFDVVLMVPVLSAWNVLWPSLQWGSALYLPALKSYFPNLKRLTLKVDHIFWLQSSSSTSEINPLVAKDLCFESLGRVLEDKKIREEVLYDHGLVMEALYDHGLVMEALCDCPGVRVFYLLPVEIGSNTYGSERWEVGSRRLHSPWRP